MIDYNLDEKKACIVFEQPVADKYSFVTIRGKHCLLSDPSMKETILVTCDEGKKTTSIVFFRKEIVSCLLLAYLYVLTQIPSILRTKSYSPVPVS